MQPTFLLLLHDEIIQRNETIERNINTIKIKRYEKTIDYTLSYECFDRLFCPKSLHVLR